MIIFIILSSCVIQNPPPSLEEIKEEETAEVEEKQYISASLLKNLIDENEKDYMLIDVRTEEEYNEGHIPTAIHIPHTEIGKHIDEISKYKLIIVYCKVGVRASIAASKLREMSYKKVINFGSIDSYRYELDK